MESYPNGQPPTQVYGGTSHNPSVLSEAHRRMLFEESVIDPGVAAERGYATVKSRADLLDFKKYQRRAPALRVPVYSPDGVTASSQLRPDKPRKDRKGKVRKYETPGGSLCILDVHPRMREEVRAGDSPIWLTEGIKKSDSLASRGLPTVGVSGVWNWQRGGELLPCWDHVSLEGRRVYVVFDADVMVKEEVQLALQRLVTALEARGAEVLVVYLPGPEKGVDDYLAAGGTVKELKMLARRFEPQDLARIRLSRDDRLRLALEDLGRRFWSEEWKGMGGHSDRDVALKLVEAAARHGKSHPDGIRVVKAWGTLGIEAKVSSRTLAKAICRLEERGFLYRDNEGREADKAGAFVLKATARASVKQYGQRDTGEGDVTQTLRACNHGTLHLRAPRLRWSSPKVAARRGTVRGTRKVRQGPPREARPAVKRLGKIRGAILDALDANGGTMDINELADALHRKRPRDLRRRNLQMLEEAGILEVDDNAVTLAGDWLERLEEAREIGGEIEAEELTRERYERKRRAYHGRRRRSFEPDQHYVNVGADGWVEDLVPADAPEPELSPLAAAMKGYLERNPHDAKQPPGWLGLTLWAYDLFDGKPTPEESRAAWRSLEELKPKRRRGAA